MADVTGLDCIGIPVFMAVRPGSETLAVSQGKGATPLLAKISAVMESIETWAAERPTLTPFRRRVSDLGLPYPMSALCLTPALAHCADLTLDWYWARGLLTGDAVPVPVESVRLSFADGYEWRPDLFPVTSTGLASGNSFSEASLHALYEVIERAAVGTLRQGSNDGRCYLNPDTIPSKHCRRFVEQLKDAHVDLEVSVVPNEFAVPTAIAFIWSYEYPAPCAGSGSHASPVVAVSRAISEAVQTRLTEISGTRDDIDSTRDIFDMPRRKLHLVTGGQSWAELFPSTQDTARPLNEELAQAAAAVARVTGYEPLVVDISPAADFSVVRVVCPGMDVPHRGHVPR